MPRLLIAYDGSEPARSAVAAAGALLPGAETTVLVVAHSVSTYEGISPSAGPALQELEQEATERAAEVAAEGVDLATGAGLAAAPATASAIPGVWAAIIAAAEEHDADVIVCGTRGHGAVGHAILGSTSGGVLHHAHRSVLVVPRIAHMPAGPAMLAYDGSDGARHAVVETGRLLGGREVVVAHAWRSLLRDTLTGRAFLQAPIEDVRGIAQELEEMELEAARERLQEGRALAEEHGLRARAELIDATDSHWHGILDAARAADASLLVAGSRGRGGITAAVLGSISTSLAHNADRPTLIVRPPA